MSKIVFIYNNVRFNPKNINNYLKYNFSSSLTRDFKNIVYDVHNFVVWNLVDDNSLMSEYGVPIRDNGIVLCTSENYMLTNICYNEVKSMKNVYEARMVKKRDNNNFIFMLLSDKYCEYPLKNIKYWCYIPTIN